MYESADDNQLMARIARADETAMETLFTRHQGRVYGFIHRILRNDALADELTNEVFMEVWRGAPKLSGPRVRHDLGAVDRPLPFSQCLEKKA